MAVLPDIKLDAIVTEHNQPAAILVRGLRWMDHTSHNTLQELHDKTGALCIALDDGVSLEVLSDEDLARVGLRRLDQ